MGKPANREQVTDAFLDAAERLLIQLGYAVVRP